MYRRLPTLSSHVRGSIDFVGQLRNIYHKSTLNLIEDFTIYLGRNKGDGKSLSSKATSSANPVKVSIRTIGHIVVNYYVNSLDIYAPPEEISGNHDSRLEILEFTVAVNPLLLAQTSMNTNGWEIALLQQLVELPRAAYGLHENHQLVKLQGIEQVHKLSVLLLLLQRYVVLLQPVKCKLAAIVNVYFERLSNKSGRLVGVLRPKPLCVSLYWLGKGRSTRNEDWGMLKRLRKMKIKHFLLHSILKVASNIQIIGVLKPSQQLWQNLKSFNAGAKME